MSRSHVDEGLRAAAVRTTDKLLIHSTGKRMGVSRTLRWFEQNVADYGFPEGKSRVPVVLDLCRAFDHTDVLVDLRNRLVRVVNRHFGISSIGTHLFLFDAMFVIWRHRQIRDGIKPEDLPPLAPTSRRKLAKGMVKIAITMASAGTFELITSVPGLEELARKIGWEAGKLVEACQHYGLEHVLEERIHDMDAFMHQLVAPSLSPRLRIGKSIKELEAEEFGYVMLDLLVDAIAKLQSTLRAKGHFLLLTDAADEASEPGDDAERIRFSVVSLSIRCPPYGVASALCGRHLDRDWAVDLQDQSFIPYPLDELTKEQIRSRLFSSTMSRAEIEEFMTHLGATDKIPAGKFSDVWKRKMKNRTQ